MIGTGDQSLPEGINFNVALNRGLLVERLTPAINDRSENESDKNGNIHSVRVNNTKTKSFPKLNWFLDCHS
jgi:hypothetical protein